MEISNLSDAELKTLMVRMLKDLIKYGRRNEGPTKEMQKNSQETNSEGKEAGIQINDLEHKEEINFQPEQKETRIQKKWG